MLGATVHRIHDDGYGQHSFVLVELPDGGFDFVRRHGKNGHVFNLVEAKKIVRIESNIDIMLRRKNIHKSKYSYKFSMTMVEEERTLEQQRLMHESCMQSILDEKARQKALRAGITGKTLC